jgi:alpha-L-glutamate ligase-like protein
VILARSRKLRAAGVLGLNRRNGDFILPFNDRSLYPLVDNKVLCKTRLQREGLAVPALIGVVESMRMASHVRETLAEVTEFVIKPANGSGGDGILVIQDRVQDYFVDNDGRMVDPEDLEHHLTDVIGGLYSLGGQPDVAMIESLVHFDPAFSSLTYHGVPDIRVIVFRGYPVMAMTRLPTRRSHGKANLHQGAIGVGIDLASGMTMGGVSGNSAISHHPDTGAPIEGFQVPGWAQLMSMSAQCFEAVGLGYLGVDIVLDRDLGPLILELNARPGLNIQIANRRGLRHRLERVQQRVREAGNDVPPQQRAEWAGRAFGTREVLVGQNGAC